MAELVSSSVLVVWESGAADEWAAGFEAGRAYGILEVLDHAGARPGDIAVLTVRVEAAAILLDVAERQGWRLRTRELDDPLMSATFTKL